jgi:predicted alpha-1,2-mannosidase
VAAALTGALTVAAPPALASPRGPAGAALVADPLAAVDPFIGTRAGFNVFPGPDVPFGMIQWSPETQNRHSGGGYEQGDSMFRGFALTHMSGPGCNGYGDIPILPILGGVPAGDPGSRMEPISHVNELASPGYYAVTSSSPGIRTELTSTTRTGSARIAYPAGQQASLLIKLLDSQNGTDAASAQIVSTTEVSGSAASGHFCGSADRYTLFFDIRFDKPFTQSQVISVPGQQVSPNSVFLSWGNTTALQARIGISFVSVANARANLAQENPTFNFDGVRNASRAAWTGMLNKIQIGGGTTSQQRIFYTSLYRALLHPNVVSDVNGQYFGFDKQTHTVTSGQQAQYGTYSGWDIYRTQAQLSALVAPQQMRDSAQSMINDAVQSNGQIPKWATAGGEAFVMVGDPGTVVLADYAAFGVPLPSNALQVMLNSANNQGQIRPGLNLEKQFGYIPEDATNQGCCNFNGSVGTLLEYNIADAALSFFARSRGDTASANALIARAQNWRNILNPANKFMNPKRMNGSFIPVTPTSFGPGYVEGTAAQYRFLVPFNQKGLATALGGNAATNQMLDFFLSKVDPNQDDTAAMHNEVDIGMQYFPSFTGQPWKTQETAHRVRMMFKDNADTFGDNDDLGTMTASYVWQALGMYPVTPGRADLVFNSPLFPEAVVHLPSGNTITITAPGASESNFFVQSQRINGTTSTRLYLPAAMLTTGATIDYTMGNTPNTSRGTAPGDAPPSYDVGSNPGATRFEAENATISPGSTVDTNHPGFSGTGFVNTPNVAGSFVEWTGITRAAAGTVTLTFGYANGSTANRPTTVTVNGGAPIALNFPPTGSWDTYGTVTLTVALQAGANTIRATATAAAGTANLDYLDVPA